MMPDADYENSIENPVDDMTGEKIDPGDTVFELLDDGEVYIYTQPALGEPDPLEKYR